MAIRVTHGDVSTFAKFGMEAGAGEQAVRERNIQAEQQLQSQRTSAAITQANIAARNRLDLAEFDAHIQTEAMKRQRAWEVEKLETSQRNSFERMEFQKDLEIQMQTEERMQKQAELNRKKKALDDAAAREDISPEEAAREKLRLEIGVQSGMSPLFRRKSPDEMMAENFSNMMADKTTSLESDKAAIDAADSVSYLRNIASSGQLDWEDVQEINTILNKPGVTAAEKIQAAELVRAKTQAKQDEALVAKSGAQPLGADQVGPASPQQIAQSAQSIRSKQKLDAEVKSLSKYLENKYVSADTKRKISKAISKPNPSVEELKWLQGLARRSATSGAASAWPGFGG